LNPIQKL